MVKYSSIFSCRPKCDTYIGSGHFGVLGCKLTTLFIMLNIANGCDFDIHQMTALGDFAMVHYHSWPCRMHNEIMEHHNIITVY